MNMVVAKEKQAIINVDEVRTPIKMIFKILIKTNFIKSVSPELGIQSYGSNSTR